MPDNNICETYVLTWWERISALIFNDESAAFMCNAIDPECEVPEER